MKQCPYCKASLEESARFCMYCMSSLEEKKAVIPFSVRKRAPWFVGVAVGVTVLFMIGIVCLSMPRETPSGSNDFAQTTTTTNAPANIAATTDAPANATTTTTIKKGTDTYSYREAVHDDLYMDMTIAVPSDTVVVTGVLTPSADGIYRVPNTIDGKRVVAIAAGAFAGEDVRAVVLPANMATINEYAFSACPNLTDIYYLSNAIYTYPSAFAPPSQRADVLTIHCAWDCSNRNFRYYRNIAADWFDAVYQEWNGGDTE